MNDDVIIKVEDLSKRFLINKHLTPKTIMSVFKKSEEFEGMNDSERIVDGNFWALRDINFEVRRGETMGIIGANGAGKTTLLKIISKILKQTTGTYTLNGRVASLIGVGTGFHQELTGRENVYFNGALLGMRKDEITSHFEEIVEFAEIGGFIDTPIKYYSSGMRSRLAFSVAMNLDAEIMIIDEALAVGDVKFKEKSSEKMRNTAFTGKTVLFVTHSMGFLQEVCDRSIIIDKGRLTHQGSTEEMIDIYLNRDATKQATGTWKATSATGDDAVKVESMYVIKNGRKTDSVAASLSDTIAIGIDIHATKNTKLYNIGYTLFDEAGRKLWRSLFVGADLKKGHHKLVHQIDTSILRPSPYYVSLDVEKRGDKDWIVNPKVTDAKISFNLSGERLDITNEKREGAVKPSATWEITR